MLKRRQNKLAEINFYNKYGKYVKSVLDENNFHDFFKLAEFDKINAHSYVLEVGCGKGEFGRRIAEMGHNVVGIDLNREIVDDLNRGRVKNYTAIEGDVEDAELFQDKSFDGILCACILHHLPSIELAVKIVIYG